MRAGAALGRELEHLRTERRDHPSAGGYLRGIERVQILDQHVVGLAVLLGVLRMPDADAEQKPAGISVLDAVVGLGHLVRRRGPHVDDAGGDLKRLGALEYRLDIVQVARG